MRVLIWSVWAIVILGFTACVKQPVDVKTVFKPLIYKQCKDELKNAQLWKVATVFMSNERQTTLENQTCRCVADHALDDISTMELTEAMLNEETKKSLVKRALLSSVKACLIENRK